MGTEKHKRRGCAARLFFLLAALSLWLPGGRQGKSDASTPTYTVAATICCISCIVFRAKPLLLDHRERAATRHGLQ